MLFHSAQAETKEDSSKKTAQSPVDEEKTPDIIIQPLDIKPICFSHIVKSLSQIKQGEKKHISENILSSL